MLLFNCVKMTLVLDVDIAIFTLLDADTLYHLCLVNKYYNYVHGQYLLWYNKIKQLHDNFPITKCNINCILYKQLYYCLLNKKYNYIVPWIEKHNNSTIINWFIHNDIYCAYYTTTIHHMLRMQTNMTNKKEKAIVATQIFYFILNNKILLDKYSLFSKDTYNKLLELNNDEYYGDVSKAFMKAIFDN